MANSKNKKEQVGTNVAYTIEGDVLTITVDISERHGLSTTGRTMRIATTGPSVDIGSGVKMGLNVYTKEGV